MRRAEIKDYEKNCRFLQICNSEYKGYGEVCSLDYDQHPTDKMILDYIRQNAMYVQEENGIILGAVAITMSQKEDYHNIDWQQELMDDEVAVVHILCV